MDYYRARDYDFQPQGVVTKQRKPRYEIVIEDKTIAVETVALANEAADMLEFQAADEFHFLHGKAVLRVQNGQPVREFS
jgi:hypothetical protein